MYLYVQKSKNSIGMNSDTQKSLNSSLQKSSALQRNKNDSLSIICGADKKNRP